MITKLQHCNVLFPVTFVLNAGENRVLDREGRGSIGVTGRGLQGPLWALMDSRFTRCPES